MNDHWASRCIRLAAFFTGAACLTGLSPSAGNNVAPTNATLVRHDGYPVLQVNGRPFFVFGAAFFYERIPRDEWRADLLQLRDLGINTIDLYVIWNWHETGDGVFDFDGHSNSRRDLRGMLRLIRELGFMVIVRPGPVIRNEWRNA
ncbi:MAG: beta-galactosidase, partial [Candidatus Eremiobacteraeota bacterium]|nr:beta-galactosidase [Candidatus Eremiobacteraeota bacterium]